MFTVYVSSVYSICIKCLQYMYACTCLCVFVCATRHSSGFHVAPDAGSVDDTAKFYETGALFSNHY